VTTAMEQSRGPGHLLADRYRLGDLLHETHGGRFLRAHDLVLSRDVAVHLIAASDPRADDLLAAARRSAALTDRRILRVLDAESRDDTCYVVTEWAEGTSLDILLDDGPLEAQRAAWLTAETASALATAHAAGHTHGRLRPENILIDATGTVRILGFAVDAALTGLPPGPISGDVADLAAILYAALTGRWPGRAHSDRVPRALYEAGRVLRARQVRAGVPTTLDAVCDHVLSREGRGSHARTAYDLSTALGISEAVAGYIDDPTLVARAEATAARVRVRNTAPISLPPEVPRIRQPAEPPTRSSDPPTPEASPPADPASGATRTEITERSAIDSEPREPASGGGRRIREPEVPATAAAAGSQPDADPGLDLEVTQAGVPIFHDDSSGGTEVSWFAARTQPPPPPPPFEPAEPKPLFAPEPPEGVPLRRPRVSLTAARATDSAGARTSGEAGTDGGFWPWGGSGAQAATHVSDEDGGSDWESDSSFGGRFSGRSLRAPGLGWLRIAASLAVGCLLLLAIVAAYNVGQGQPPLGGDSDPTESPTPSVAPPARGEPLQIVGIADFDPQANPREENPDLVLQAFDGNPDTAWRTQTYNDNFGLPNSLKDGVGLVIDLGKRRTVTAVTATLVGEPTEVSITVSADAPAGVDDLEPVQTFTAKPSLRANLDEPSVGRYVTLWLTSLPEVDGGFQAQVAEVVVRGD
jgi:serine/threonine kinase PknH